MPATTRIMMFAAGFTGALLLVFLQPPGPFGEAMPTAVAALALLMSLPMVDSALMGRSVHPMAGGALLGLPVGFFLRQAQVSPQLASGAGRILAVAFVVSAVIAFVRWRRSRRQSV